MSSEQIEQRLVRFYDQPQYHWIDEIAWHFYELRAIANFMLVSVLKSLWAAKHLLPAQNDNKLSLSIVSEQAMYCIIVYFCLTTICYADYQFG